MPIRTISADGTLTAHCIACKGEASIDPADVELGVSLPGNKYLEADPDPPPITFPDNITLPPCPGCGAQETLQQNFDTLAPQYVGTRFDLQRRAVNAYAQKLKALGRKNADCATEIDLKATPLDIMTIGEASNLPVPVKGKFK